MAVPRRSDFTKLKSIGGYYYKRIHKFPCVFTLRPSDRRKLLQAVIDNGGIILVPITDVYEWLTINRKYRDPEMMPKRCDSMPASLKGALRRAKLTEILRIKIVNTRRETLVRFAARRWRTTLIGSD